MSEDENKMLSSGGEQDADRKTDPKEDASKREADIAEATKRRDETAKHAAELRQKVIDGKKTDAEREAETAEREAAQANAKLAEMRAHDPAIEAPKTAGEAHIQSPMGEDAPLGLHGMPQRANHPLNPPAGSAEHENPDLQGVKMTLDTLDGQRETFIHPDSVGDHIRAGWTTAAA